MWLLAFERSRLTSKINYFENDPPAVATTRRKHWLAIIRALAQVDYVNLFRSCRALAFWVEWLRKHRRRSWVNFGVATHFCPKIYVRKINKMPEFYLIFARKITKFPNFTWYLPEYARIFHDICPKIFFPKFGGRGTCLLTPVSCAYA